MNDFQDERFVSDCTVGTLVKICTDSADCNYNKTGLIVSGADPRALYSLSESSIEHWLFREVKEIKENKDIEHHYLEPAYIVRINGEDYIYSAHEFEIINGP